jgi:hypothetical protein
MSRSSLEILKDNFKTRISPAGRPSNPKRRILMSRRFFVFFSVAMIATGALAPAQAATAPCNLATFEALNLP